MFEVEEEGALKEDIVTGLGENDDVDFFLRKRYAAAPEKICQRIWIKSSRSGECWH